MKNRKRKLSGEKHYSLVFFEKKDFSWHENLKHYDMGFNRVNVINFYVFRLTRR